MDKTLEKFGIYNLLAVLFAGAVSLTLSAFALMYIYGVSFEQKDGAIEWAVLLILSYVLGLVLQELGTKFQKIFFRNNRMLKKALQTGKNSRTRMTAIEKERIYEYAKTVLKTDNDNVIYNYCRFYVVKYCDTTSIERDQSLSAMSRSFFLYFAFFPIGMFALIPSFHMQVSVRVFVFLMLLSAAFSVLMYSRYVRFAVLRYVYIYRSFYYYAVLGYDEKNLLKAYKPVSCLDIKLYQQDWQKTSLIIRKS